MNKLPDEIREILSEEPEDRQKTTLEIAAAHMDCETQLAPRLYAEWYIRTNGGKSPGGKAGSGFRPWLTRNAKKINRGTAYRLLHRYAATWGLPRPEKRSRGNKKKDKPEPEVSTLYQPEQGSSATDSGGAGPGSATGAGPGTAAGAGADQDDENETDHNPDFVALPTSPAEMKDLLLAYLNELDDQMLEDFGQRIKDMIDGLIVRRQHARNNVAAA